MAHSTLTTSEWISTLESHVIYETAPATLTVTMGDLEIEIPSSLQNGRVGYPHFEFLVSHLTGLSRNTQSAKSDCIDWEGQGYEVKSFKDVFAHTTNADEFFNTGPSRCFSANNLGPLIKTLLDEDKRDDALDICIELGYQKSRFYIYTNTSDYLPGTPFRFIIVPVEWVLENLPADPRDMSRDAVWESAIRTEYLML